MTAGLSAVAPLEHLKRRIQDLFADGRTTAEISEILADDLDEAVRREVIRRGLISMAATWLGHMMERDEADKPVRRPARAVGLLPAETAPGPMVLAAGDPLATVQPKLDGTAAPLAAWRLADWKAWEAHCRAQSEGWFDRAEVALSIADLLKADGVDTIAELRPAFQRAARNHVLGIGA